MNIALAIIAFILLAVGLAGTVLPVLPGPALSYVGLLVLQWSGYVGFSPGFLWLWAGITLVVSVVDFYLPAAMTRRFGGSRAATVGAAVGIVAGIFFMPPAGIIIGPFLGALIGELINNSSGGKALKVALGSFVAFILGTGAKMTIGVLMIFYAVKAVIV